MRKLPTLARKFINRFYPPAHLAFYLQRTVLDPSRRRRIARFLASRLPRFRSEAVTNERLRIVREMERDGFSYVSRLITPEQIKEIFDYLGDKLCYDRWRPERGDFHIRNAPPDCHVAPYKDADVLHCPHLLRIANSPDVLAVTEELFGCKPTLSQLSLWWSLPGHAKPEEAEFFRRDVDEWQFIKLFVYLTDVDPGSGPHVFVKGSPSIPKLLPIKSYQDAEVEREFGVDNIIHFTGKAGTAFLENTFGFHKGPMPSSSRRLLFQAQYSLLPIGIYQYSPLPGGASTAHSILNINRPYVSSDKTSVSRTTNCGQLAV